MMFVEQLAAYMSSSSGTRVVTTDAESLVQASGHSRKRGNGSVNWTTTLGLVVHAAADGIALGAAAATNQLDVEIIVFLAIMLHKVEQNWILQNSYSHGKKIHTPVSTL